MKTRFLSLLAFAMVSTLFADESGGVAERETEPSLSNAMRALRSFVQEQTEAGRIDTSAENWRTRLPKFPDVPFDDGGTYLWTLETSDGTLVAKLNPEVAPEHVRNILYLSDLGFYDGLGFHRIMRGFMAQGGCPLGRGNGSPGYTLRLEVSREALHDKPGVLSMARSPHPDSAGSQFFITFAPRSHLDMQYSVFGHVVEGLEVLEKMEGAANPRAANGVPTLRPVTIKSARVSWQADEPGGP